MHPVVQYILHPVSNPLRQDAMQLACDPVVQPVSQKLRQLEIVHAT